MQPKLLDELHILFKYIGVPQSLVVEPSGEETSKKS